MPAYVSANANLLAVIATFILFALCIFVLIAAIIARFTPTKRRAGHYQDSSGTPLPGEHVPHHSSWGGFDGGHHGGWDGGGGHH